MLGFIRKGRSASGAVQLQSRTDRLLAIERVTTSSELLSADIVPTNTGTEYALTVTLSDDASAGLVEEEANLSN